jgi:hypothetical protein
MTYQERVLDVFTEHHSCMGMDQEEIQDIISETPFNKIKKWLDRNGYDLSEI